MSSRGPRDTLRLLLRAFAPALLRAGVTAQQIADLAKDALIESASATARMASGRVNQSKIAAATGLTRPEIRRRLQKSDNEPNLTLRALDRSTRVLEGWCRDPMFLDDQGKPRELSLRNHASGFPALVRRHSGDIPARAVLETLQAKQLVVVVSGKARIRARRAYLASSPDDALPDVASYIADTIQSASRPTSQLKFAHQVKLVVDSQKTELLLTENAVAVLASAIASLGASGGIETKRNPAPGHRQLSISVTLIASPNDG